MMNLIDENALIEMHWTWKNKDWYEGRGYQFTKIWDTFFVKTKDLSPTSKVKIPVTCDICGEVRMLNYGDYKRRLSPDGLSYCSKCKGQRTNKTTFEKRRDSAWERLEKICSDKGYTLITKKDEYISDDMTIEYICPIHGEKHGMLQNMLRGKCCFDCAHEKIADGQRYDPDYIADYISNDGNALLNKEDYQSVFTNNLRIQCSCGNEFTTSFQNYRHGQNRCSFCSHGKSRGEQQIHDILLDANILFEEQKTFSDLKDKGLLRYDFYLPDYNLIIEYDGEGHYQEIFYKNRFDDPKQALTEAQRRDRIKDDYCNEHGINILRIPYWEEDYMDGIIFDKIDELKQVS